MEDLVISARFKKKFRNHSAMAECHFAAPEADVRAAIVASAESLPNFSMSKGCFDDTAQLELAFVTPGMKWLDIVSVHMVETRGKETGEPMTELLIFSHV